MTHDTPLPGSDPPRWIRDQIDRSGPVPFHRFMDWALFHPAFGYYSTSRVEIGDARGDFTTSPHQSPLFARCLARWIAAIDRTLDAPDPFTIVEGGPGEGRLAVDLLDTVAARWPDLYRRLLYAPEERSGALADRQSRVLASHGPKLADPSGPFEGVYLSNELLDAFPVRRFRGGRAGWEEAHVAGVGDRLAEVWLPPAHPDPAPHLDAIGVPPSVGVEVEVRPGVDAWMGSVAERLVRGVVVTVDYGDEGHRLYGPHRPRGTCVAYRAHRLVDDLLADPGRQDLTAHVDFSAVVRAGQRHGLAAAPLRTQRDFLFAAGLVPEMAALDRELAGADLLAARQAVAPLLAPDGGMGSAFRVLVQTRGVPPGELPLDPTTDLTRTP